MRSTGKLHSYLLPSQVPAAMEELIANTNDSLLKSNTHPLIVATRFHQQFLNVIHPFSNGNGLIGRIFVNLIFLKSGYPPIFIKDINKDEYLRRFEVSDEDINPTLDFMADRLQESLDEKLEFLKNLS